MDIILYNSSDKPIYEQISSQVKAQILSGALTAGAKLPSIRALASDLGVSVITTKRAYADLEQLGFICTVQRIALQDHLCRAQARHASFGDWSGKGDGNRAHAHSRILCAPA